MPVSPLILSSRGDFSRLGICFSDFFRSLFSRGAEAEKNWALAPEGFRSLKCPGIYEMASSPPMNLTSDQISCYGLFPQPSTSDDASDFAYLHTGKTILVTGAGGSIGSALAKTIHRFRPRCLLLIDSSEQALYRIHSDLSQAGSQRHVPILG